MPFSFTLDRKIYILLFAGLISLIIFGILKFSHSNKLKGKITHYFEGHVRNSTLKKIKDNASRINLQGEEKVITTMFIDIRGFTKFAEQYSNRKVFKILNGYLTEITAIIIDNYGTVDKYLGDGVMAFWGAPLYDRYQVSNAMRAAAEILKCFENKEVQVGIGINSGSAIIGNLGGHTLKSYTAIGDSVNTAARVEALNKHYGTKVLFTKASYDKLLQEPLKERPDSLYREIDKVKVYGKNYSTVLYELVGENSTIDENSLKAYEYFNIALNKYRDGDWQEAESLFRNVSRRLGSDNVSKTFIDRCKEFAIAPPQGRWDGTILMNKL